MMKTGIRQVMPVAQVGTVTVLALLDLAALYTPMIQTGIRRVIQIVQVLTVTELALLTEQAAV